MLILTRRSNDSRRASDEVIYDAAIGKGQTCPVKIGNGRDALCREGGGNEEGRPAWHSSSALLLSSPLLLIE